MSEAGLSFELSGEVIERQLPSDLECHDDSLLSPDEIPDWLSEAFIENILRRHFKRESLKVNCLRIQPCGGKGESYASIMYRVGTYFSVSGSPKAVQFRSYIVKTLPQHEMALEKLGSDNYNVQNNEMEMYDKVLPEFKRLLASIGEDAEIFPGAIAVVKALDVIVMEDLLERKFEMPDRTKGLDSNHILMALRQLARMHAASAVLYEENPKAVSQFDSGFFTRRTDCFHVMFETLCDAMIEEVSTWEGYEYYAQKLPQVRKNLIENARRAFDCDEGDFHVLNHGDIWTNNLMYTYDDAGQPKEAVLLDFQYCFFGSPVLDLIVSANSVKHLRV